MFRIKRFSFIILILLISTFSFETCIYAFYKKEFESETAENKEALLLALLGILPNPNQKLFGFIPGYSRNLSNSQFLNAEWFPKSTKKKIVFVHGWNPAERDSDPITNDDKKIQNIKNTFSNGIIHFQEGRDSANIDFDLYLYTYRTSNSILSNGRQFNSTLRAIFSNTDSVYIVAHSMGGLVTRVALSKETGELPFVRLVVTLASPQYGSPFASKNFLEANPFANELGSYLVDTQGGQELSYTNVGNLQPVLFGANNLVLDVLNDSYIKFGGNSKFISFAGVLSQCNTAETFYYQTGCTILANSGFTQSDGIVPLNSARLGNLSMKQINVSDCDHSMMAFQTNQIDDLKSLNLFSQVITEIRSFP
ncbi:lipase family alpha/beta hydrolase [Leptospira sp. WS39.C2]